ncbi:TM0106 family RecB-like putative nuclease [Geodermatophilus sp. CPCC 206100]|uniref:TM0106 family RecB-like putative nuclease n=1 Tax=Geodermatophilus sp. CPCC 206100 TaxID=3020054 RepID=UPI003AFFFBB7
MTGRPVLLGGYAARRCPRATHNSFDRAVTDQLTRTAAEHPELVPAPDQQLLDLGIAHEATVFGAWLATGENVVDLRPLEGEKRAHIAATLQALDEGRAVVLGGRLPDDPTGGRTGKPDALIREAHGRGYHPCDVKAHRVLSDTGTGRLVADLPAPALTEAVPSDGGLRHHEGDLLQLAHYWRMLEACGRQASAPWGAIVGTDGGPAPVLAWYDLAEPVLPTFSRSRGRTSRSALERYDHEHDFRLRVAHVARQRTGGATDPEPLVTPVGHEECVTCSWKPVCVDTLPDDDVSRGLLGTMSVREYLALRGEGIEAFDDLAGADVDALLESTYAAETTPDRGRARRLRKAHVAAQLFRDGVVLRLRPGAVFDVPRAEVEIDLDMECTRDNRVYLWGVLVTTPDSSTFHPFLDLDVDDDASEAALARRCFDWVRDNHPGAVTYHYSPVERTSARRILGATVGSYAGTSADLDTWVDLLPPTRACLESRKDLGIKVVAQHGAGFTWRDEDPGGRQSQNWLDEARAGDRAAADRILAYNEDDVRATLAVRNWLADVAGRPPAAR